MEKLKEILAKLKEAGVGEELLAQVQGLDMSKQVADLTAKLEAEQGKNAGILEDKRKFKDRAEAAETELKSLKDKSLSSEEKMGQELEKLRGELTQERELREQRDKDLAAKERDAKVADLTNSIKWAQHTPADTAKLIVRNALEGVDLSDAEAVKSKMENIVSTHKGLIASSAPAGTGTPGSGTPGKEDEPATMDEIMDEVWAGK